MSGAFISVEGIDGAGKTTHLGTIQRVLKEQGIDPLMTREPGGTRLGERLRDIVLDGHELEIGDAAELLIIFAARQQHIEEVISPTLANGRWVVSDRFTDASYAYQGYGRGLSLEKISQLESWVQGELRPQLTLIFDVPVEIGLTRTDQRGQSADRFESEQLEFKQKVRLGYLERAKADPERITVIDSSQSLNKVTEYVENTLQRFVSQWLA